jgi:hypothetical protein
MRKTKTPEERFWPKVNMDGPVHPVLGTPCWLWTASTNGMGYGQFSLDGKTPGAHVVAFVWANGPVPVEHELDHLCHTLDPDCTPGLTCPHRLCVNPAHLEAVGHAENMRRGKRGQTGAHHRAKTHCPYGHPFEGENLYVYRGKRKCRACRQEARDRHRAKQNDQGIQ